MTIERMTKQYISILKINMVDEARLKFRLRKFDENLKLSSRRNKT